MESIGVGVVGCGYWGPNLIRNFARHSGCRVVGVCDANLSRAERVAREYGIQLATGEFEQLLEAPGLNLVVVATPSFTHFELAAQGIGRQIGQRRDERMGSGAIY